VKGKGVRKGRGMRCALGLQDLEGGNDYEAQERERRGGLSLPGEKGETSEFLLECSVSEENMEIKVWVQ